jgi:hypothetical protein
MATLTENLPHAGGYLISEGNGDISREVINLTQHSETYVSGTVLGEVSISKNWSRYDSSASDGTETAKAVLWADVDASAGVTPGVITARMATVNKAELVFSDDQDDTAKEAAYVDLAAVNIIAR